MESFPALGRFGSKEVRVLCDVIHRAYSDAFSTDTWIRVLDVIRQLVPYDGAGAVFANVQTGQLDDRIYRDVSPEFIRWYDEYYPSIMVIANDAQARGLSIWRPPDVIGKLEWEASEIRSSLLSNFGFNAPVCMTCGTASQLSARFWFLRKIGKGDFADRELNLLELLQPHFCEALRLAKNVFEGNSYREAFQNAFRPAFICDSDGKIMRCSKRGKLFANIGGGDGEDRLAEIEAMVQRMIREQTDTVTAELAGQKCQVYLSTVVTPHCPTSHILTITSAEQMRETLLSFMLDCGLSKRETEICLMVAQGKHNREIAEKLYIAESTVKDHVTSIFEKLQIDSRGGIVSKLLGF